MQGAGGLKLRSFLIHQSRLVSRVSFFIYHPWEEDVAAVEPVGTVTEASAGVLPFLSPLLLACSVRAACVCVFPCLGGRGSGIKRNENRKKVEEEKIREQVFNGSPLSNFDSPFP